MRLVAIILFIFLFQFSSFCSESNILDPDNFLILEDTSNILDIHGIIKRDKGWKHTPLRAENPNSSYWIQFDFSEDSVQKSVLEVITSQTEEVTFFRPGLKGYEEIKTGQVYDFNTREYRHKNFTFDIISNNYNEPFYLKIKSRSPVEFLFKLQSNIEFSAYSTSEYWMLGFYYGALSLLAFYHLIVFFVLRHKVYLFYVLSVVFAGLISSSEDGFGPIFLWSNLLEYSKIIGVYILPVGYLVSFGLYANYFLDKVFKKGQTIIKWGIIGYVVVFGIQSLFSSQQVYFPELYPIPFLIIYGVFVWSYLKHNFKPSLFFLIGFSFSLFGLLVNQLRLIGVLEGNVFTVYAFNIGIVLEFLSLALSISYKFKQEQAQRTKAQEAELKMVSEKNEAQKLMFEAIKEKEKATAEINKTLEVKVEERTSQLNDLIVKLKTLNFDYDKENWDLKRNVRVEKERQLLEEKLSLKEIISLYPTNYKCWEFLSDLKWSNGDWQCKNCGYEKHSVNAKSLARKCSRCSTAESPTVGSVFQSQRIPLNQLFYVTYKWSSSEKINVKELSDELKISEVSLYKFLKRLNEKKSEKLKQKSVIKSWVDLIF